MPAHDLLLVTREHDWCILSHIIVKKTNSAKNTIVKKIYELFEFTMNAFLKQALPCASLSHVFVGGGGEEVLKYKDSS